MAIHVNGISGSVTGKNGGNVFGAARTRWGKLTTSRAYKIPADPKTPDQLLQRELFRRASLVTGLAGRALYRDAWNNTLGELPGWNAMVSYITSQLEGPIGTITYKQTFDPKSLGPVYMPTVETNTSALPGQLTLEWDDDLAGDYSSAVDKLYGFVNIDTNPGGGGPTEFVRIEGTRPRSSKIMPIENLQQGADYFYCVWFSNIGADGIERFSPIATGLAQPTTT